MFARLTEKPAIKGLTDALVDLDEDQWRRALARLREVRLLSPLDPSTPDAIDAHPLVRDYFETQLERTNLSAWCAGHGRVYEHLRDTTKEGPTPTLADLAPLYQAIAHGCRAGWHQQALDEIFADRVYQRRNADSSTESYALNLPGAFGTDLAALSWFFDKPYETPVSTLTKADQSWVLSEAGLRLKAQGRLIEGPLAGRAGLRMDEAAGAWLNAVGSTSSAIATQLLAGAVSDALTMAQEAIARADETGDKFLMILCRTRCAIVLHAAAKYDEAARLFAEAERRHKEREPNNPLLYGIQGCQYCDLLITRGDYVAAIDRATKTFVIVRKKNWHLPIGLDTLTIGRAHLGLALEGSTEAGSASNRRDDVGIARTRLGEAVETLCAYDDLSSIPLGLLAGAAFRRSVGDWDGAAWDLNEIEEIAQPGPMKLYLCDMALERARLALARVEAFAPLNGFTDDGPREPVKPDAGEAARLIEEARANVAKADRLVTECGYHRRDDELAELQAVEGRTHVRRPAATGVIVRSA